MNLLIATRWLAAFLEDGKNGNPSIKRAVLLMASAAMSVGIVILSIAAANGYEVSAALAALAVPLAGMAGYGYVGGKRVESTNAGGHTDAQ